MKMVEIKFNLQELAFLTECINQITIKGIDAPFVTGVIHKIKTGAELLTDDTIDAAATPKKK